MAPNPSFSIRSPTESRFVWRFSIFSAAVQPRRDMRLVVSKGRVIDPISRLVASLDILVEDGHIAAVGQELSASGATILDASGRVVVPGLIDMHVHLREPGFEPKEHTETRQAG